MSEKTDWKRESEKVEGLIKKQKKSLRGDDSSKVERSFWDTKFVMNAILFVCVLVLCLLPLSAVITTYAIGLAEEKYRDFDKVMMKRYDDMNEQILTKLPTECKATCYPTRTRIVFVKNDTIIDTAMVVVNDGE